MAQLAVEMRAVVKKRKTKTIGPLNLALPEGYITALVGHNGAGKSTLLNLLQQQCFPDGGEISWFGQSASTLMPAELRQAIGVVPEVSSTEEDGWRPDEAAAFRRRWFPSWDQDEYNTLMHSFEIPQNQRLGTMSKGERRKFELAAALAIRPKLLLLDEPSSGLDPFAWKIMMDALQRYMNEQGGTVLVCTHVVEEVRRLADYIALMHRGRILGMAEKDGLYECWQEVWLRCDSEERAELERELPDALNWRNDVPGVVSCTLNRFSEWKERLADLGVQVIRSRNLDLEEALQLWTEGHSPGLVEPQRGEWTQW